ncbi:protein-export chaperone SecB [Iodobacter sp. LRB]|uniref:Protein-export protein SecB n=2 Tax=Iodobacter TaxID=32014 RepID=A0A377Q4Z7_9NEIS|nr:MULTISPECIES: protein-export chaperone SecB [Iodobacter]NHQ84505.1 protein-export chaperone SecB [Iodobacter violacea]PHV00009.1 protein-export chaperone SecB [Iodobacter sp. BJB302]TCU90651.1 protein translocase subunit secB [Iodobacter fluviatilis]STQ89679.1 Protein-export protein secB [Iodobacter fluviatilis]
MSEQNQELQPVFAIQKLYVKDISLESPNSPQSFLEQAEPEFNIQFRNQARSFDNGFYEVSLTVTAQATVEDRTIFLVEVTQNGLFNIENVPAEEMDPLLGIGCPSILFPYLREAVSDLTTRAGFPPLMLQPINFEAIYLQQRQQAEEQAANAQTTH